MSDKSASSVFIGTLFRVFFALILCALPWVIFSWVVDHVGFSLSWGLPVGIVCAGLTIYALIHFVLPFLGQTAGGKLFIGRSDNDNSKLQQAEDMIANGQASEGLTLLEHYRRDYPEVLDAWVVSATLLRDTGHPQEAADVLETAMHKGPGDKEARALFLYKRAVLYRDALHDRDMAMKLFELGARKYPRTAYGVRCESAMHD